jgi:aconitate hydratase
MSGALDPKIQQEIIDRDLYTTAVLSGNRNFDGRIHPYAKQAFLASPPLVVAYAIAGTVRFDIEKDVLGVVDGKEIRLKDIWPSDEEIDAIVARCVKPEQFRRSTSRCSIWAGGRSQEPAVRLASESTYIRRPPYWEGALAGERTLKGMRRWRCCRTTSPPTTCRRPTPSCSSAAGEYLAKMGLPEEDFNSYATHRGDHLTAQRATFANPQLVNEMAVVDGAVKKGSLARIEPEGKVTRMWEAIETYMARKQPLIIIAGADYGQGSSRDWAAKGVRLAGWKPSWPKASSASTAPTWWAWACCRWSSSRHQPQDAGHRRHRKLRRQGRHLAALHADAGDPPPQWRDAGSAGDLPSGYRRRSAGVQAGGVLQRFAQDFLESTTV